MAEITRPGPVPRVRPIDSASVVTGPHAAQILGDLAADVIEFAAPHATLRGREHKYTSRLSRDELPDDTQCRSCSPKPSKSTTFLSHTTSSAEERSRKHVAVSAVSACVNHHHNNENEGITYA
jgi:hypothetical protein